MIPDEALDAAVDALIASRLGDHKGINGEEFVEAARAALDAAAPIIRAQALEGAAAIAGRPENRWWAEGQNRAKWLRLLAAEERGNQ